MATNRLFTFNNGSAIGDALQYGNLSISDYPISGYRWWPGPDEDIGYIIAHDDTNPNMRTEGSRSATVSTNSIGFWRSAKTSEAFLIMSNDLFNLGYASASAAAYWLTANGYWTSYTPQEAFISKNFIGGGSFSAYNGTSVNGFVKLNTDGTIDNTFSVGTGFDLSNNQDAIQTISVQNDGKILVGGLFTSYNGTSTNNIVRLNGDGSIDTTFNIGSGFDGTVLTTKVQPNGKILVCGGFNTYNGASYNGIVRLNSDGTVDSTFVVGTGFSGGLPYEIVIQPNGKILVGGIFTSYNGTSFNGGVARLNSDGSVDNTIQVTTNPNLQGYIFTLGLQTDGKILIGGTFNFYFNLSRNRLVRLNSDATIDNTFDIGSGFDVAVFRIKVQYDGKILVGGAFTEYNGTSRSGIVRLNSDGSIDTDFNIGTGFARTGFSSGTVYDLKIQDDGKIIVIGQFNSYNGTSCNGIVRLNPDGSIDSGFTIGTGLNFTTAYPPQAIA